ncbi:hypothetical protein ACFSWE_01605 [Leucobacter albus]|uniref:LPXTG-motif cell wall-anchored protein n=1 Tax=Leucobacter albus TaxID=272210 RepID=A0ABW3TQB7_9MICO
MTARRLLATMLAGSFAAVSITAAVVAPSPAHAHELARGARADALTVTPARGLFHVTLHPGEEARAVAQVHNGSGTDLELALTPIVVSEHGLGDGAAALTLSSMRTTDCSAERMAAAPAVTLAAAMPLSQGTIAADSTVDLCVQVRYPEAFADEGAAVSVVDLAFTGIERQSPGAPDTAGLVSTGANDTTRVALLLGAAALLAAGFAALPRRTRQPGTARER